MSRPGHLPRPSGACLARACALDTPPDATPVRPPAMAATLPPAVSGDHHVLDTATAGRIGYYAAGPDDGDTGAPPLLLVHSINAAGSAREVRPLYEHYRTSRTVYAPDLPGFGSAERGPRDYTPRLMTDAVLAMVDEIRRRHGPAPVDALAVSLGCEFLARAASERPGQFRSLALVSPTGFNGAKPWLGSPGSHRGSAFMHAFFTFPLWSRPFWSLLTSRVSMRFFLEKTWGSKDIDEGLLDYDHLVAHQPGARHAPFRFVSGYLFSADITRIYEALEQPVWMAHGERGDFVDYRQKDRLADRPNWRMQVFDTGALPHFELPGEFISAYDAFLRDVATRA